VKQASSDEDQEIIHFPGHPIIIQFRHNICQITITTEDEKFKLSVVVMVRLEFAALPQQRFPNADSRTGKTKTLAHPIDCKRSGGGCCSCRQIFVALPKWKT